MAYKVSVIGGGSTVFGPKLINVLVKSKVFQGAEVSLMDIDEKRVTMMRDIGRVAAGSAGSTVKFECTTDRKASLQGAHFVIVAAPVGGLTMRELDIEMPAQYGLYVLGGETVGPGAMMRGFRHIPVLLDICREMEELCPDAWMFSYTNPTLSAMMAVERKSDIKKVFLCTCSPMARHPEFLSKRVKVPAEELAIPVIVGGLNHCSAILRMTFKDGTDALPSAKKLVTQRLEKEMLDRYGILPYAPSHWAEFYPRYLRLETPYKGRLQGLKTVGGFKVRDMSNDVERARIWEEDVQTLLESAGRDGDVDDMLRGSDKQAELLEKVMVFGEEVDVVDIMESIVENRNEIHGVIVPNRGAIPNLPFDTPIEISSVVGAAGVFPLHVGPLPEPIAANMRPHVTFAGMTVDASFEGSRKLALDALLSDPLTSSVLNLADTEKLLDEMLKAQADFLPQFS